MQHYAEAMLYQFPDNQIHAANDAVMRTKQRCRTVPIPSTITAIPGYPNKLAVFKIAASKFWQVRCWITGKTHRRSTQTQSLRVAQSFARQFYEFLLAKHYIGSNDADDLHTSASVSHLSFVHLHPSNPNTRSAHWPRRCLQTNSADRNAARLRLRVCK
jgi:hypothetical protein